jgi:hypothetical protein
LRFAITSPPSGCEEDLHLQAVNHARRTRDKPGGWPGFSALLQFLTYYLYANYLLGLSC